MYSSFFLDIFVKSHRHAAFPFSVFLYGSIRFYSGLMELMSDQELLFVIGHEIGHVVKDHVEKRMTVALLSSALRKGIVSQQNIVGELAKSGLGYFLQQFSNAQFSQEEEKAADDYALEFMKRHGYDAEQAVSALQKLAASGAEHNFLSSHPAPEDRAERLRARLRSPDSTKEDPSLIDRLWGLAESTIKWISSLLSDLFQDSPQPEARL